MSAARHRAVGSGRGSAYRSGALGVLALLAALVIGLGGRGTFAYWNDSAAVASGTFSAGKLDITVNNAQGNPTPVSVTSLALPAMVPGESVAANLTVANVGDADFTWVPTVSKSGPLATPLVVEMSVGGSKTGEDTTYPRTEGCAGGTALASGATAPKLAQGAPAQTVCVKVSLPLATGDGFQNAGATTVGITLVATQVVS